MADSEYSEDVETLLSQPTISRASPRPKSGRKSKKGKSGSPYGASSSSKTAHELWGNAVKGSDTAKMSSFSGLKKSQMKNMSYASTSTYLKHLSGGDAGGTPRKSTDGSVRASAGRPAYKSQEEYYDEVIALKKQIQDLNSNNSTLKLKIRRMEEDNLKKEKQIEELLDPSKSDEMRRTMSEKRPDSSTVIHGLKQKVLKLEHQLKEREGAYHKLQSDLKSTKVEELKAQMECFYKEIMRLNQVKSVAPSHAQQNKSGPQVKETPSRLKALQETIMRMNEKNVRLTAENKTLKEDLGKVLEDKADAKDKQREYTDMSKKELLNSISKLEKRLDKAEEGMSLADEVESRGAKVEGKVKLEGTMAQKMSQLDQRETELIEEVNKHKGITKKLKEDRIHYRKKCDEKDKDIKALKKDIDDLEKELDQFYDQDKSRTPRVSPRRPRSSDRRQSERGSERGSDRRQPEKAIERERSFERKSSRASSISTASEKERLRKAEKMRENHAARTIQRSWRKHQDEVDSADDDKARARKVKEFSELRAARRIQRGWLDLQARKLAQEEEETAEFLQSNIRGHQYRKKNIDYIRTRQESPDDTEEDDRAEYLQSSMRSHKFRKEQIKSRSRSTSPRTKRYGGNGLDSEGEEYDDDYKHRRTSSRTAPIPRSRPSSAARKSPRHLVDTDEEDDSDDEDLVVSAHSRYK